MKTQRTAPAIGQSDGDVIWGAAPGTARARDFSARRAAA